LDRLVANSFRVINAVTVQVNSSFRYATYREFTNTTDFSSVCPTTLPFGGFEFGQRVSESLVDDFVFFSVRHPHWFGELADFHALIEFRIVGRPHGKALAIWISGSGEARQT
jgi:hypothetical protein